MKPSYIPLEFKNNKLHWIDQTKLPNQLIYNSTDLWEDIVKAIRELQIRGAPLIGIAGAYAVVLLLQKHDSTLLGKNFNETVLDQVLQIGNARPTAVNLMFAINQFLKELQIQRNEIGLDIALKVAKDIQEFEIKSCDVIGQVGAEILRNHSTILTHCNTGPLATGGIGTALGVLYQLKQMDKQIQVYVTETSPVGQGARLTVWELQQMDIPVTLIPDTAVTALLNTGRVNAAIVGADRVTTNGDVANKIGTANIACACEKYSIPFYSAFPMSTVDYHLKEGNRIPIEFRSNQELLQRWNLKDNVQVWNPAFDVTPAEWITGLITEKGFFTPQQFINQVNSFMPL